MQTITLDLPDDILIALSESENELKDRIKLSLAMHLYASQKLTIGKASQICGMHRLEFENELSKNNIPISNLEMEDILSDMEKLK